MGEPKLRFKADDGSDFPDWEEMTFGDIGNVTMCKRVFKDQTCEVGDVPFSKLARSAVLLTHIFRKVSLTS